MLSETLPADLGDCIRSLKEIREMKLLEIRKLTEEKEQIEDAQLLVELMQEDQDILERLRAKRQKTSPA
jgi:arsenate reductase-like glutaredoxin family protein